MEKLTWHTEKRKISDLILFDGNPRQMSEKQAKDLMKSLSKFNIVELPVIDQNNRLIAGNMRITALKALGRSDEDIEVRVPNRDLTEEEAKEYLLRSNKNVGEWNIDLLTNFDNELLLDAGWEKVELENFYNAEEELVEKQLKLKPYKKTHILLSFAPKYLVEIEPHIKKILEIDGVEYEQGSN
jgi:hypothetical protein